jgi:hypothetical protein
MDRRFVSARVGFGCAVLAAVFGVAGCGGVKRIPTSGKVTLDGKPMPSGVLQFIPDASKGNNLRLGCSGPIVNGRWNLVTSGMARADTGQGAPVGWFKVVYTDPNEGSKAPGVTAAPKVAAKYQREDTTPLSIELKDPPPPEGYTIELTSK